MILPSDNNQKLRTSHHVHCYHPGPFLAGTISLLTDMSASTRNHLQSANVVDRVSILKQRFEHVITLLNILMDKLSLLSYLIYKMG